MRTVTVSLFGIVPPGLPRKLVLALDQAATIRSLLEELSERGGDALRRAIWAGDGRVEGSVLIAVDGEVVDPGQLDDRLIPSGDRAEISLFLIRPIFGGSAPLATCR
jgi:hypothetical protein